MPIDGEEAHQLLQCRSLAAHFLRCRRQFLGGSRILLGGFIHLHDGVTEAEFVSLRTRRDATLEMPVLILPAVQVNIRAGALPPAEDNGVAYLKIPLNAL